MDIDDYVVVNPNDLLAREPFARLFKVQDEVVERITTSMKARGFDPSHPIHIWRRENCIVDGHQRVKAALAAGVEVYAYFHDFADEDAALDYAIHNQQARRNLTDAGILRAVKSVDKKRQSGRPKESSSHELNSSQAPSEVITSQAIGTTPQKVKNARAVLTDPQVTAKVESGSLSLNAGANEVRSKKKAAPKTTTRKRKKAAPAAFDPHKEFAEVKRWNRERIASWPTEHRAVYAFFLTTFSDELCRELGINPKEVSIGDETNPPGNRRGANAVCAQ
jgi:hypothetical protein